MDRTLRLIRPSPRPPPRHTPSRPSSSSPPQPLPVEEMASAAEVDPSHVEQALEVLRERFAEGRSGIVLEHVAGGWAFRASSAASDACMRLFDKPVEKGLSQAALETLAIIACSARCRDRRSRGSAASTSTVSSPAWPSVASSPKAAGTTSSARFATGRPLRARLRARVARGAPAGRRSRRGRGADPRAPRNRRREAPGLTRYRKLAG